MYSIRDCLREQLAADVAAFEASGNEIERLPPGAGSNEAIPFNQTAIDNDEYPELRSLVRDTGMSY